MRVSKHVNWIAGKLMSTLSREILTNPGASPGPPGRGPRSEDLRHGSFYEACIGTNDHFTRDILSTANSRMSGPGQVVAGIQAEMKLCWR